MRAKTDLIARVAAIYDIHGNLPALEAVLAEIAETDATLIVGGDVASGPMPRETIERLMSIGNRARFVRGNADREVVAQFDRPLSTTAKEDVEFGVQVSDWSARQITLDQRDFLASFTDRLEIEIDGLGRTLFCHGSPRSDEEIITSATPAARMEGMLDGVAADIIVCGHTHVQFDRTIAGKRVINAGSVGLPYEGQPGAYWVMLGPDVSFKRTDYDFERAANQISVSGVPGAEEFARENVLTSPSAAEATAHFEQIATNRISGN